MAEPEFRWTQDEWADAGDPSAFAKSSPFRDWMNQHGWLLRVAIVVLGLVVFELTANAVISTAVSCLEFGRTDFQTAWWLLRTDPDRRRSSICCRCYVAWGLWRVSLMAMGVIFLLVVATIVMNQANPGAAAPPEHVGGAFALLALTLSLASVLSMTVIVASLRTRTRIWLGPEPRQAKQQGIWPPSAVPQHRYRGNQSKVLFYLGCFGVLFPTLVTATFACFLSPLKEIRWVYLGILMLMLLALIAAISHLERRVLAGSPADCWPRNESGAAIGTP